MDFARVIDELAAFFAGHELRWAIIGGVAMAAYGLPRTTLDLDFVVDRQEQDSIVSHMEAEGYQTLHRSPGYSNHLHEDPARGRVDFVYLSGDTARRLFAGVRAVHGPRGSSIPVPSPEHIAALKVHAMASDPRRKGLELSDLRFLLTLPGVDREAVHEQLRRRGLEEDWHALTAED